MSTIDELLAFLTVWVSDPLVVNVFFVILITAVVSYFARKTLARLLLQVSSTENPWDDALLRTVRVPLNLLIWVIGLSIAAEWIAEARSQTQIEVIALVRYLAFIGLVTLFLTRLIKELETAYLASGGDETTVTAVAKLLRISLFVTAALMTMQRWV